MITIIVGTNRPGSNTRLVARQIEGLYADLQQPVRVLDLAQLPAEVFAPTAYAEKPASFAPFADAVLQASGLHVVTPEYNGSMPGVLKYFIDLLKFPESFERRPVCFTGLAAGTWGALRPVEQLQQIFGYRNAHIYPERVFIPGINDKIPARRAFSERAAINAPMQGTAADLIKMSMNQVQKALDEQQRRTRMIMQVHDELVFELPESEVDWVRQEVPRIMASVASLRVPLLAEVGVGRHWDEAH